MRCACLNAYRRLTRDAEALLSHGLSSAYAFGSSVYDDFHVGYSDLDFLFLTDRPLTQEDFHCFHRLRDEYKASDDPCLSVLEGEFVYKGSLPQRSGAVVYWGTSKDRFNDRFYLADFSLTGLLEKGVLLFGRDERDLLPKPDREEMLAACRRMIETVEAHAQTTGSDVHSADWFFLLAQTLYYLKVGSVTAKTRAAKWLMAQEELSPPREALRHALTLRNDPALAKSADEQAWLSSLGGEIQALNRKVEAVWDARR